MIIDHVKNIQCYDALLPGLGKAYALAAEMAQGKEDGRYEFDGGFFLIQTGRTKPMDEGNFEAHRRYADIQIVIEGSEEVAWAELSDLHEEIAYNLEKDALYLSGATTHHINIGKEMFYIAFPHDAHRPVRHIAEQQSFKKIVLKLPVKELTL